MVKSTSIVFVDVPLGREHVTPFILVRERCLLTFGFLLHPQTAGLNRLATAGFVYPSFDYESFLSRFGSSSGRLEAMDSVDEVSRFTSDNLPFRADSMLPRCDTSSLHYRKHSQDLSVPIIL